MLSIVALSLALLPLQGVAEEVDWQSIRDDVKPSVVNLWLHRQVGLGCDETGASAGTGFVVNKERGWIVTNQHVTGQSRLSRLEVTFANGEAVEGKLLYYDPWHDFAFIEINPEDLSFELEEAELGSIDELDEGEEVLIIGNSSREGYSTRVGRVSNLFRNMAVNPLGRHSHQIHVSVGIAGGNSGGPVFNKNRRVIGLTTAKNGENTESFHLRTDYISDALADLLKDRIPLRGEVYTRLLPIPFKDVQRYLKLPASYIDQVKEAHPTSRHLLGVKQVVPRSPTSGFLRSGDVILSIQGKEQDEPVLLAQDLFLFDQIADQNVGGTIKLTIFRDGEIDTVEVRVDDAQANKIHRYVLFADATFHEVTPDLALYLHIPSKGVFLSESRPSASFDRIGRTVGGTDQNKFVVIHELNGQEILNLSDFIAIAKQLKTGESLNAMACDVYDFGERTLCRFVDLVLNHPLAIVEWNFEKRVWEHQTP